MAPFLEGLGFHEPPFFVRSKVPIRLEIKDQNELHRGRIDVLVIRCQSSNDQLFRRLKVSTVDCHRCFTQVKGVLNSTTTT